MTILIVLLSLISMQVESIPLTSNMPVLQKPLLLSVMEIWPNLILKSQLQADRWTYCNYRVSELQVKTYFPDFEGQRSLWFDIFNWGEKETFSSPFIRTAVF